MLNQPNSALYDQVKAAYLDNSEESYQVFEELSLEAMETMDDEEWEALCAELMGGTRYGN